MPRHRTFAVLGFAALAALAACGSQPASEEDSHETAGDAASGEAAEDDVFALDEAFLEDGRMIIERHCLVCHTDASTGGSPRPDAPPLRVVLMGYDAEALAEDFRNGIHLGHPDMPQFQFSPDETDEMIAYLLSIQVDEDWTPPEP